MIGKVLANPEIAFYAACALLLLAGAVAAMVLKPVLALWALAYLYATEYAVPVPLDTSLVKAGSTHIYPADALAAVLLIAAAINLIRRPPPARIMVPLSVAGTVFAMNLVLGVARFGLHHAVNESREWLYLLVTTAFVVTAGPWTSRFWRPWFALAATLVGLAWLGVARHGLHPVVNGQRVDPRALTSGGALAIAFVLVVMLGRATFSVRRKIVFGIVLIGTLVVVQQRTVWAVLVVMFLIWAAASLRRQATVHHRRLATAGVAVLGTLAVALSAGVAAGNVFERSLAATTTQNSSFQWRLIGWFDLLHTDHSSAGLTLGLPFGTGYLRTVQGVVTNVAPHSYYVATILRLGVVGLIALAFLYWNVWAYRGQAAAALGISPLTVALLLVGLLVFSLTYEPGFFASSVIAGLLIWELQHEPQATVEASSLLLQGAP